MCIIIDANVANEFASGSDDSAPVLSRLTSKKLKLVAGGKLKVEWSRTRLGRLYQQLLLSGAVIEYTDEQTDEGIAAFSGTPMRSDDPHVLGLARVSGARILFSRDERLHEDFKNKAILPGTKGKVYQSREHARLLDEVTCSCRN